MLRRHRVLVQNALIYFDVAAVLLSYFCAFKILPRFFEDVFRGSIPSEPGVGYFFHLRVLVFSLFTIFSGFKIVGIYESQRMKNIVGEWARIILVNLFLFVCLFGFVQLLDLEGYRNWRLTHILLFLCLNTSLGLLSRLVIRGIAFRYRSKGYNYRNLIVLATAGRDPSGLLNRLAEHPSWGYKVLAVSAPPDEGVGSWTDGPLPGNPQVLSFKEAVSFVESEPLDEIWIDGMPRRRGSVFEFLEAAMDQGISLRYILPRNYFPGMRWNYETFDNITTLSAAHSPMDDLERAAKRAVDLFVASSLLVVAIPFVMLPVSVALFFQRGGKRQILFRQDRVGVRGRIFTCYKFRSMVPDAEAKKKELEHLNEMGGPAFKMHNDPRITPFGAFIRKSSIDEFPQFFNVLKGNMSLVGPRPPIPSEVNMYERTQKRRLSVKPGITGLWQVSGRNDISDFEEWVALDLEYIDQWSFWLDIKILLMTIPAVFKGR
ncbi:MAG: sugar transferase [Planctomycetota bacterium]|jgi:exopolysaccharide biosynthesis polyprenyl glycosylphosphotransferase|nr:sugar transferase [Planctomycetota bacterium]MDP6941231.1 sugar transferase [Planctomycetota bacterium]